MADRFRPLLGQMLVDRFRPCAVGMPADNDIRLAESADRTLDFAEQGVIIRHDHRLADGELNGFQSDNQLIFSFVNFCLMRFKIAPDFAEKLI